MIRFIICKSGLAALLVLATSNAVAQEADRAFQSGPERAGLGKLIAQLGSSTCADREQAAAELAAAGGAALPFLREAAKSADVEVARRATRVIAAIEEHLLTATLLQPRRFRVVVRDLPIAAAVAELSSKSGYSVKLNGITANRKVTLDTGDTTFWDALQQLCAAADLVEKPAPAPMPAPTTGPWSGRMPIRGRRGGIQFFTPASIPAAEAPIELTVGKVKELPTCHVGSVRIRALPGRSGTDGHTSVVLEVAGEPRLRNFGVIGLQRLDEAIDDRDQRLALSLHQHPAAATPVNQAAVGGIIINGNAGINRIVINGGNVIVNGNRIGGPSAPPSATRTLMVSLDKGAKAAASLRTLSGVLLVQGWNEPEVMLTIDPILPSCGKSIQARDGATVEIQTVEKLHTGDVQIKLIYSNPDDGMAPGGMFGNLNIAINGRNVGGQTGGSSPLARCQPRLFDSAGRAYTMTGVASHHVAFTVGQATHTITYLFHPQAGQGDPARLTISGQRLVTFRVPFTLKDVPLP
jgi:hypothetical protein